MLYLLLPTIFSLALGTAFIIYTKRHKFIRPPVYTSDTQTQTDLLTHHSIGLQSEFSLHSDDLSLRLSEINYKHRTFESGYCTSSEESSDTTKTPQKNFTTVLPTTFQNFIETIQQIIHISYNVLDKTETIHNRLKPIQDYILKENSTGPLTKSLPSATAAGINRICTVLEVSSARLLHFTPLLPTPVDE